MDVNEPRQLLIESFDRRLAPAEQRRLDEALARSEALRRERDQLQLLRESVSALYPAPDPAFPSKVVQRLRQEESVTGRIVRLLPPVAAACLLLFLLSALATYVSSGSISPEAIIGTQELTIEDAYLLTME